MNEKFRSVISHSSDDKVKVVYAWQAPRGPVWNTEVPNILALAAVAEGVNPHMHSRNFWTDDLYPKIFRKAPELYELAACQNIEDSDQRPFIYPFSLMWRVPFEVYFIAKSGLIEFSHMPHWLVHLCATRNGYILIDHSVEAFMQDRQLSGMYSYFHGEHFIPMHKIIYLTGTVNGQTLYDSWATRNNIPNDRDHRMTVIPYASSREIFNNYLLHGDHDGNSAPEIEYNTQDLPEKLFLSWNRRFRSHRIYLGLLLEHLNLVDRSLISFPKVDSERKENTFLREIDGMELPIRFYNYNNPDYVFNGDLIRQFNDRLPLVLDGETDVNKMCEDFGFTADFYKRTLVSIVTETNFTANECTLTEKSFKPILHKHPFIIVGVPGALQGLRDLGFKTFGDFWDESYDTTEDPGKRFYRIAEVLKMIGSWSDDQILDFKRKVKPIIDHNYELLKTPGAVVIAHKIYNHISDNFITEGIHHATCGTDCINNRR